MFNLKLDGWKLTGVMWSAMPAQIPQLIALFLVVAFGARMASACRRRPSTVGTHRSEC